MRGMIVGFVCMALIAGPIEGQDAKSWSAKTGSASRATRPSSRRCRILRSTTFTSRNSIAFQLNTRIVVQLAFVDAYDTEAEARGARSNNDGQIFFSLAATF